MPGHPYNTQNYASIIYKSLVVYPETTIIIVKLICTELLVLDVPVACKLGKLIFIGAKFELLQIMFPSPGMMF